MAVDKAAGILKYSNPTIVFDKSTLVVDKKEIKFDDKNTSKKVIDKIGSGWN